MTRVAMLVANQCNPDMRVIKQAESLASDGLQVRIYCLGGKSVPDRTSHKGVEYVRLHYNAWHLLKPGSGHRAAASTGQTHNLETQQVQAARQRSNVCWQRCKSGLARFLARWHFFVRFWLLRKLFSADVCDWAPDIVHVHDLIMLPTGTRVSRRTSSRLIYDAHELETDRNPPLPPLRRLYVRVLERRFARHADAIITVSEPIALDIASRYGVPRPHLVMNAPRILSTSDEANLPVRHLDGQLCDWKEAAQAAGPDSSAPIGVYVGKIMQNRGLDIVIDAMVLAHFTLLTVGDSNPGQMAKLRRQAQRLGVNERWIHCPPIDADQLVEFISSADFGIVSVIPVTKSYDWSMPNKLFECALAGLPLVATDAQEISRLVRVEQLGLVYESRDSEACAAAIQQVIDRGDTLRPDAQKLSDLRAKYGWPAQHEALRRVYQSLAH